MTRMFQCNLPVADCTTSSKTGCHLDSRVRLAAPIEPIEYGGVPEWPKGTDCKSAAFRFDGSNPSSPTNGKSPRASKVFGLFLFLFPGFGVDKKYEKIPKKYSILVSKWCQASCSVLTDLMCGQTLFWHVLFHSGVELPDGFFVLGGAKVGVDFAGDLYAGVA